MNENVLDFFAEREKLKPKSEPKPKLVEKAKPNETSEEREARLQRIKRKILDIYNNGYNPEIHGALFED